MAFKEFKDELDKLGWKELVKGYKVDDIKWLEWAYNERPSPQKPDKYHALICYSKCVEIISEKIKH